MQSCHTLINIASKKWKERLSEHFPIGETLVICFCSLLTLEDSPTAGWDFAHATISLLYTYFRCNAVAAEKGHMWTGLQGDSIAVVATPSQKSESQIK